VSPAFDRGNRGGFDIVGAYQNRPRRCAKADDIAPGGLHSRAFVTRAMVGEGFTTARLSTSEGH